MSSINHRLWLRVAMNDSVGNVPKKRMLERIIETGDLKGDIKDLMTSVVEDSDSDCWLIPLSGPLPTYAFDGAYARMTPDWGVEGRAMADIVGGLARTAGKMMGNVPLVGPGVSGLLNNVGSFIQTFAGDIDSPKIWQRSEFKSINLGALISFDNKAEFIYYRMAELWFTLMTIPRADTSSDAVKKLNATITAIGKFINVSSDGPVTRFNIAAMRRPYSDIGQMDIVVGESEPLTYGEIGSAVKLKETVDKKSLLLFAMNDLYLSSFSAQAGGDKAQTLDSEGVPRLMQMSFTFEPAMLNSVLDGMRRLLSTNSSVYKKLVYGTPADKIEDMGEKTGVPLTIRPSLKRIAKDLQERQLKYGVSRIEVESKIAFVYSPTWIAEALIYNILNINLSVSSIEYMAGRVLRTVGPVRSIQSATGKKQWLAAGIPGLIYNTGRKLANTIPTGGLGTQ